MIHPFLSGLKHAMPGALPGFERIVVKRRIIRDLQGLPASLGRSGTLEVLLATTKKDIRKAQKLRWRVFFENGAATAEGLSKLRRRDICPFDRVCDHILVVDHAARNRFGAIKPKVVGAYRLLRQDVAERNFGFYSAAEFDIAPMLKRHANKRFLELGRSCVLPEYRGKKALELLWRGIWTYVRHHRIDAMFGCASLEGADAAEHSLPLTFLHHYAPAAEDWRVRALPHRRAHVDLLPRDQVEPRRAVGAMPPLVKGYLRIGAVFGEGAVVDAQFGTTDVFVVMPVANIDARYIDYFTTPSGPIAAAA